MKFTLDIDLADLPFLVSFLREQAQPSTLSDDYYEQRDMLGAQRDETVAQAARRVVQAHDMLRDVNENQGRRIAALEAEVQGYRARLEEFGNPAGAWRAFAFALGWAGGYHDDWQPAREFIENLLDESGVSLGSGNLPRLLLAWKEHRAKR
jgi:hypothetical protein